MAAPPTWNCPACTFANNTHDAPTVCAVCETPRDDVIPEDLGQWGCAACTFLNGPDVQMCQICGTAKPPPRPSRLARVMQEDTKRARTKPNFKALAIDTSMTADESSLRPDLLTPSARQLRAAQAAASLDSPDPFAGASSAAAHASHSIDQSTTRLVAAVARDDLHSVVSIIRAYRHAPNLRPPPAALESITQFIATVATASSQGAAPLFAVNNLVGAPQVFPREVNYGLIPGCWHPETESSPAHEFIDLRLARAVYPTAVRIFETLNPGAVVRIAAHDGYDWVDLWTGVAAAAPAVSRIFSPPILHVGFASLQYLIELDTAAVAPTEFNAIDAIEIVGDALVHTHPALDFDVWQKSPLHVACKNGNAEIAAMLLAKGADSTRKSMWGFAPLDWAVFNAKTAEPVAALPVPEGSEGAAAAMASAVAADAARGKRGRYHEIVRMLLAAPRLHSVYAQTPPWVQHDIGAGPVLPPHIARPPAGAAAAGAAAAAGRSPATDTRRGRRVSVRTAGVTTGPDAGREPAPAVASSSTADLTSDHLSADDVARLLATDPRSLSARPRRSSPTHHHEPVMSEIQPGAEPPPRSLMRVFAQNSVGETVFHFAAANNDLASLELLLSFGSLDPAIASDNGVVPQDVGSRAARALIEAATTRHNRLASEAVTAEHLWNVLRAPAGIDMFALHHALSGDRSRINAPDDKGHSPLQFAIRARRPDAVCMLLCHGADPLAYDRFGNSALFTAVRGGAADMVRLILSNADTVARLAVVAAPARAGFPANRGEERDWANANGDTLLHAAVLSGHPHIVSYLLALPVGLQWAQRVNNQGLRPSELTASRELVALFADAIAHSMAPLEGGGIPLEPSAAPIVCAVCMLPPVGEGEGMAYTCECGAAVCDGCFIHLTSSSLMSGEIPGCCNGRCHAPVPLASLRAHVTIDQMLVVTALAVNSRLSIESVYKSKCPICLRANDLRSVLASTSPRYQCAHCKVSLCSVCSLVYPRVTAPSSATERTRNELDDSVHSGCLARFGSLRLFTEFYTMLERRGLVECPACHQAGLKDSRCTHGNCANNCAQYCLVCGRDSSMLNGVGVSTHGTYDIQWSRDPSYCCMYAHHMAHMDERIAALGCGVPNCRPQGTCANDAVCREVRDTAMSSLLNQIRVRCYILDFVYRVGKAEFVAMIERFKFKETIDRNYFNSRFPWDGDDIPQWWSFEPASVQDFYKQRLRWFVMPADLPRFVRAAGAAADGLPTTATNAGGGATRYY